MNVQDQRSGRGVKRREEGTEETESLLANDSARLLPRGKGVRQEGGASSDDVSVSVSARSVLSFRRAEGSVSMEGEDDEGPPAYTSTPITPSHTQQDGGVEGKGGEAGGGGAVGGGGGSCQHSQVDGLTVFLKTMVRWVKSVGGLIVLLLAYTFLGAWIMITIEGPAEFQQKQTVYNVRESIADELRNNTQALQAGRLNDTEWKRRTDDLLLELETVIHNTGVASTSKKKWTFFGAVLFCVTTYTTIGYGNIAPTTKAGRIATMLYATIGIPLALIVLADLGHRLTNGLKFVWGFIRRYYYTGYCRKVPRRRSDKGSYDMNESNIGVDSGDGLDLQHEGTYTQTNRAAALPESQALYRDEAEKMASAGDGRAGARRGPEAVAKPHLQGLEGAENSPLSASPRKDVVETLRRSQSVERTSVANSKTSSMQDCRQSRSHSGSPPKRQESVFIDQEELNEDFKLPVGVAVGFIFVYIFAGAGVYKLWEDWTYLESFYFVFITTSTIGFGDVLPEHPNFFLLSCVYTFLGLALVSMTINVIMEWLAKTIDRAKEKVDQAREKAMAKAKAATDKLTEVGSKAKSKVLNTVGREGSATPELNPHGEDDNTHPKDNDHDEEEEKESKNAQDTAETDKNSSAKPEPDHSHEETTAKESDPQSPGSDSTAGSPRQAGKAGTDLPPSPSSDNEASFRTATDFTASSDSVNEQNERK